MFEILETDRGFDDSPDVGDIECICSRCGDVIIEGVPLRVFLEGNREYRYHPKCVGLDGCWEVSDA